MDDSFETLDDLVVHEHDLMDLFETLSFREKWQRVAAGLKQPPDTGAYKWAKLQTVRLLAPLAAVLVPVIMFCLISIFAALTPETTRSVEVKVVEPEPLEELEDIEEPIDEEVLPPEEMDFEITTTDPTMTPTENVQAPPTDFSPQPVEFDAVAMVKSPVIMKGIYGSRNPGARGQAIARFGGGASEASVLRSLRWLKKNQNEDGSWNKTKPAMASLALLAYLAHGDTPASEEFGSTVEGAIRFIVGAQKADGRFAGKDGNDYTQPICAYALSEAYALTRVPQLKESATKALKVVLDGQNPSGGFNYKLIPCDRDDSSYMAWCVQALKAAKMAGLDESFPNFKKVWKMSAVGFKKNYADGQDGYGGFGYTGPGSAGGKQLTGAGVLCLQFLGHAKSKECRGGITGLKRATCSWHNIQPGWKNSPLYYWYYISQAKFHEGGDTWKAWNKQFSPTLMKNQKVVPKEQSGYVDHLGKAHSIGSWISPGEKEHNGGNGEVMDTILCTLMLEVYYRYLPTFQPVKRGDDEEDIGDEEDELEIDIVHLPVSRRTRKDTEDGEDREDLEIDIV